MIEADNKYLVRVTNATTTKAEEKGTLGLHVVFACDEGQIPHTIWCSKDSRETATKSLTAMGVPVAALSTVEFWRDPMKFLANASARITTINEPYKGQDRVRVKWINEPFFAKPAPPESHSALADLFSDDPPF